MHRVPLPTVGHLVWISRLLLRLELPPAVRSPLVCVLSAILERNRAIEGGCRHRVDTGARAGDSLLPGTTLCASRPRNALDLAASDWIPLKVRIHRCHGGRHDRSWVLTVKRTVDSAELGADHRLLGLCPFALTAASKHLSASPETIQLDKALWGPRHFYLQSHIIL